MIRILYNFHFESGVSEKFIFDFDEQMIAVEAPDPTHLPDWARLEFNQCPHCPLDISSHRYCPPAARLSEVFPRLGKLPSYESVILEVITDGRSITEKTSLHNALRSLLGLIMGTSECPHMTGFRPMARFHLPLSTELETIYRVTSAYLLGQFFNDLNGLDFDIKMSGLVAIYERVQKVNMCFAQRMRASGVISETNAISQLYTQSEIVPLSIKESLAELMPLFKGTP